MGYDVYIMTQPRSTNAYTDKAAVFYTTAKGGIGTLTYTWQRSADGETWEDIKGAESATKLSLQAKLRWDGNQIRCKVTDETGTTAYSDAALLTVKSGDYDAKAAAEALYATYTAGMVTTPKAPVSLYSLTGDITCGPR